MVGGLCEFIRVYVYFVLYFMIMGLLFWYLKVIEVRRYGGLAKGYRGVRVKYLLVLSVMFLTLGGLPPTIGFSIKWSVFLRVVNCSLIVSGVLILGSLLSLYYYRCLRFCWAVFSYSKVWGRPRFLKELGSLV